MTNGSTRRASSTVLDPLPFAVAPEPAFVALDRYAGGWRFSPLWADGEHDDTDAVERVLNGGVVLPRAEMPRYIFNVQALFDRYPVGVLPKSSTVLLTRTITLRSGACLADITITGSASKRRTGRRS